MCGKLPRMLNRLAAKMRSFVKSINWGTSVGIIAIHIGALAALFPAMFSWKALITMIVLCVLTSAIGISLCFHRSLTHRGLRLIKPLEYVTTLFGTLALQGGPITWVATHRQHHAATDAEGDPHGADRGFLWSHVAWLFANNENVPSQEAKMRLARDLSTDPFYRFLDKYDLALQIALGIALYFFGGWPAVVWGIFVRLVLMYHSTWFVNSASHMFGYRSYKTNDLSRNNWWVAILSWGEGWHNNHHAFQFSARHGLRWFEIDPVWWIIKALAWVRLAREIKVPTIEMRERMRLVRN